MYLLIDLLYKEAKLTSKSSGRKANLWLGSIVLSTDESQMEGSACLDPKVLDEAIKCEHHVTLTLEEILPKLKGAKVFSIVNATAIGTLS